MNTDIGQQRKPKRKHCGRKRLKNAGRKKRLDSGPRNRSG
jgi:hypothetical protein